MYDWFIFCGCILVLTWMSCSIEILLNILVRIVVRLGVLGGLLVLKIPIIVKVSPQMYMGFLEMNTC